MPHVTGPPAPAINYDRYRNAGRRVGGTPAKAGHISIQEQLLAAGVAPPDQPLTGAEKIQSQFAKKAYDTYIAEMSKIGEMYVAIARNAYKPVEQTVAKKVPEAASQV